MSISLLILLHYYTTTLLHIIIMLQNSFLDKIKQKKCKLKSQETLVTTTSGDRFVERLTDGGLVHMTKLNERKFGFVVDEKPDLQVAEILPFLYLSSQDAAQDIDLLKTFSITHVLSVGIDVTSTLPGCRYKKVDLLDLPESNLLSVLDECFGFIDAARSENVNCKVLVHCNAGYSRSPSIVVAYIMKNLSLHVDEAISFVREKRMIRPNEGFMNQLRQYDAKIITK